MSGGGRRPAAGGGREQDPPASGQPLARRLAVRAPAKVNLHLEILRARPDGYHEIETIFQAIGLFDHVAVALREPLPPGDVRVDLRVAPAGAAPEGPENLCWRAARLLCHAAGRGGWFQIDLRKEIPAAAGLGGGSSDAAAVLVALNRLLDAGLDAADLMAIGAELGADVPFFVRGGTALGRGTGTRLTELTPIRQGVFLIVKPPLEMATGAVYAQLKMGLTVRSPKCNIRHTKALIARFPSSSWFGINRLEEVVLPAQPVLQRLVLRLRELAPIAMLSGSGSAVVAVFAERSWNPRILEEFGDPGWFVRVVAAHAAGVEIMDEEAPVAGGANP